MGNLSDWFMNLDPMLRTYWAIALVSTVVFAIQMVLTFIGLGDADADASGLDVPDGSADADGSADGDGTMQLFSVRNLVNFLLGIGWAGVCLWDVITFRPLLAFVAILCGCVLVACFIFMFRQVMKLEGNGTISINSYVGVPCDVYLRIPGERQGCGKVQISLHGSVQEIDAMTDGEELPSGTRVKVTEVVDNHTLLVERLS